MCGLWGAFAPKELGKDHRNYVRQIANMSIYRGLDGCGVMLANAQRRKVEIHTTLNTTSYLMYDMLYHHDTVGEKAPINLMLGHNRQATVGEVAEKNLHPFEFDRIVGAHNGTVWKYNKKGNKDNPDDLSDSYWMFKAINDYGLDDVIKDTHYGAWALTIYDKKKNHLVFLRNGDRPLFFAHAKGGGVFWASQKEYLLFAGHLGGHADKLKFTGDDRFDSVTPDTVLTYDFNTTKWLEPYELKQGTKIYPMLPSPSPATATSRTGYWQKDRAHLASKREEPIPLASTSVPVVGPHSPVPVKPENDKRANIKDLFKGTPADPFLDQAKFKRYRGYKNAFFPIEKVFELLQQGDAIYGKPAILSDDVLWFSPSDWIFEQDKNHPMIKEYYAPKDEDFYKGRVIVQVTNEKEVAVG